MKTYLKTFALCASFMLLSTSIFATEKQPKNLFLRIDLKNNVMYLGHFEHKNNALKAIELRTLTSHNEDDMMHIIQNELDSTATSHKILVFIHGMFGNRKAFLNRDFSALEQDYGTSNDLVVHIIWESQSLSERVCRQNARNSEPFITPILRGLLKIENASSSLMCHSMGNYLFFELLDGLQKPSQLAQPFERIFLMAPDVAMPVFDKKLDMLKDVGKTTEIYYNRKDFILFLSGIATGEQRLGKKGSTAQRDFIEITDCTKEKNKGFLGRVTQHSYFRTSPVVRESLKKQINS